MGRLGLRTAVISEAGGRRTNEDACGYGHGCWVVADGLGGHHGGDVAARLAVDSILAAAAEKPLLEPDALTAALGRAEAAIVAHQRDNPRVERMRTTIAVLASDGETALWAHAGDSRIYHFRQGRIGTRTLDHSVSEALAQAGTIPFEAVRHHEDRNRLLNSLGNGRSQPATLAPMPLALEPDDAFLLCTDGLWEYVTEPEMEVALAKSATPDQWLRNITMILLGRAPASHDNYSGVAVQAFSA